MAKKLTEISIAKIRPLAKRVEIPDAGKPGLYLVVQPSGKKSWAVRYRRKSDGKSRKLTLGFSSLAQAHKMAQAALDKALVGGDPAADAHVDDADMGSDLFRDVAKEFLEKHAKRNTRASSARETERRLNKQILPHWGNWRIQDIKRRHVHDLLDGIVDRARDNGEQGSGANLTLATVRKLFSWAVERELIESSPAAGVKPPLRGTPRERILTDDEVRLLWRACEAVGYPYGRMVKLLLLTGQRRVEIASMAWDELDLGRNEWTLPASRTKNGKTHIVPLSEAALDIISSLPRIRGSFLFTVNGNSPVTSFSRAKADIDLAMGETAERWTFHDLRRTAASGMARLGISLPVIEKVLNHTSGSFAGIVGVYQRHDYADEKRKALEAWAQFVLSQPTENVVPLRAAQP